MSSRKIVSSLVSSLVLSGIVAFGGAGVASAAGRSDVRGQATLKTSAPEVVVTGPARLLHVDVDGARGVSFYTVAAGAGAAGCRAGEASAKRSALRANASNQLDLDVPVGEMVCVVADGGKAEVAWHARGALQAGAPARSAGTMQAINR